LGEPSFALLIPGIAVPPAHAQGHDIVLANGRVIDPETNLDGTMHVGIKGEKNRGRIGRAAQRKEVINVTGP